MKSKKLLDAIHETAQDLFDADIMGTQTMREFDAMCLPKVKEYTATQIRRLRMKNNVSQAVFAAYLNTTPSTVQK